MQVETYLFFDGRCEEAMEFYRQALGAELTMFMRYQESPEPDMVPPGAGDKVMHAKFPPRQHHLDGLRRLYRPSRLPGLFPDPLSN
jgi:uncharacterized glyoxalase superfamily protein PhnB